MGNCNECVKKRCIVIDDVIIGGYCIKDYEFKNNSDNEIVNLTDSNNINAHGKSLSSEFMRSNNCPQFKKLVIRKEIKRD